MALIKDINNTEVVHVGAKVRLPIITSYFLVDDSIKIDVVYNKDNIKGMIGLTTYTYEVRSTDDIRWILAKLFND